MTTRSFLLGTALVMFLALSVDYVMGQAPGKQVLYPASLPTGSMANVARLAGTAEDYFQPVAFRVPDGVAISLPLDGGWSDPETAVHSDDAEESVPVFGLCPGNVYRLRVSGIPLHDGAELFPTLELLNRLYPPEGRESQFRIEVDLTREDLELALNGHLVTRVVFLENPMMALPTDSSTEAGRVCFDVRDGVDPVAVAESKGTVMAVLRLGSRVPMEDPNRESPFYFGLPPFTPFHQ